MEVIKFLSLVRIRKEEEVDAIEKQRVQEEARVVQQSLHPSGAAAVGEPADGTQPQQAPKAPMTREGPKVGRNEPCPCGSGQKFKNCHGKLS
jgi:preprotein translocase subunit SecA